MAETITIAGVDRSTKVQRETIEIVEALYLGEVGTGKMTVRDTVGDISIKGWKSVAIDQSSSSPARIGTGFVGAKTVRERLDAVTAGRDIELAFKDLNAILSLKVARDADANRSAETVGARMTWVVAELTALGLLFDHGRVTYPADVGMDANDCRGRKWGDVIADCAKPVRFNYGARYNDVEDDYELVFRNDNIQTSDTADGRISNDPADIDSTTTFAALEGEPVIHTEDPENVFSNAYGTYADGAVFRTRAATATEFIDRDGLTEDTGDKNRATAERNADTFLWESHDEERELELIVRLRADQLGKFPVGFRTQVKQVHLAPEGWGDFRWAQIIRRRLTQPLATDFDYNCKLSLSPQEAGPPAGTIVQSAFEFFAFAGAIMHLPNPPTVGNVLLVAMSARANNDSTSNLDPPNTGATQDRWGAGAWTNIYGGDTYVTRSGWVDHNSVAFYWKTVDSTEQDCAFINGGYINVGVWELSGTDMASATLVRANDQAANTTFDLGTLGTVAAGELAFMVTHSVPDDTLPLTAVAPAAGWEEDWYRGSYPIWYATTWPVVWMGHAIGDGSTVDPSLYRGASRKFCGLALLVPPV